MGVCLCFCAVPALGESWIPSRPLYPYLWIWCTADPAYDLFCTASCGCGLFCRNDRSDDLGIYNGRRAGAMVPYQTLGLFYECLEFPGVYFSSFLRFLGCFGCDTGYMAPSSPLFHYTYMARLGICFRMPDAFDPGRNRFNFIDLKKYCKDGLVIVQGNAMGFP